MVQSNTKKAIIMNIISTEKVIQFFVVWSLSPYPYVIYPGVAWGLPCQFP